MALESELEVRPLVGLLGSLPVVESRNNVTTPDVENVTSGISDFGRAISRAFLLKPANAFHKV